MHEGRHLLSRGILIDVARLKAVDHLDPGTPVLASDIPIFREIGGEAALYFAPDSADEVAARVRQLEEDGVWAARSAAGRAQAQRYTWANSAARLLAVLTATESRRR